MSGVENVRIRFSYSMIYGFGRMWIGKFSFRDRNQTIRKNKNEKFNFNNNRKENQPIKFDRVRRFGDFSWEGHTIRKKKRVLGDKYRLPCDHENRFSLFWVSFLLADHRDYHRQLCLHRRWSPRSAGFRCQQKHSERHLHICEVFVTTILS